ncbi:MAG: hypothetical protein DRI69_10255 [Bacteroidetes bacterium]|nr:MAG: hypothetical protein DRI69_10255 [Bacteroidota bacterium]
MKTWFIFHVLFTVVLSCIGQDNCSLRHDANWIWSGVDTSNLNEISLQIHFDSGNTSQINTVYRQLWIGDQNTTVSDSSGQLQFYSNGCQIHNANNTLMPNGDSLNFGNIFQTECVGERAAYIGSQGMFTIPVPYNKSSYFIFHKRITYLLQPSFHLVVDAILLTEVSKISGVDSFEVVRKNVPVVLDTNIVSSNFSATRHADGQRWWVLSPDAYGNGYFIILIDSLGVEDVSIQFIGNATSPRNDAGQGKFSPDGSKFAMFHSKSGVFLFDFDRNTGTLSNYHTFGPIDSSVIIGGCEFSPSGQFLYINNFTELYQYDLMANDVASSEILIDTFEIFNSPFPTQFFHMERTPNGQIFMNSPNGVNVLHVIKNPDEGGKNCNFVQRDIILPVYIDFTMPHFPNYRLGALDDKPCDTTVSTLQPSIDTASVKVYPNPTHDYVFVEIPNNAGRQWTWFLTDMTGRTVRDGILAAGVERISLSGLSGLYILWIADSKGGVDRQKIVVH